MTDEDMKIEEALKKCVDARLPDDFADRLVERIRESSDENGKSVGTVFTRIALVAASLAFLFGFAPVVLNAPSSGRDRIVVQADEIRPSSNHALPPDSQLNTFAFLGFCHEALRRRVRTLRLYLRRRDDED